MNYLKNKLPYFFVLTIGCATTSNTFKIYAENELQTEIITSSNRAIIQCEKLETDGKEKDRYGLMVHVLDEENTVLTMAQFNIVQEKECLRQSEKIRSILDHSKLIYLIGTGKLNNPRINGETKYIFNKKGTFQSNGRSLSFDFIKGDNGKCHSYIYGDSCKRNVFPIAPQPF